MLGIELVPNEYLSSFSFCRWVYPIPGYFARGSSAAPMGLMVLVDVSTLFFFPQGTTTTACELSRAALAAD